MATSNPTSLGPATGAVKGLLAGIDEGALTAPTPCQGVSVAALLDHLVGLTEAFRLAAQKSTGGPTAQPPPPPAAEHLQPDWRERLPAQLDALAAAWADPAAWTGEAEAGGQVMLAEVMGLVALDELVLHGWDLARATGQPFDPGAASLAAIGPFLEQSASEEGTPGLFGPALPVPEAATPLERALALSGRDPAWSP